MTPTVCEKRPGADRTGARPQGRRQVRKKRPLNHAVAASRRADPTGPRRPQHLAKRLARRQLRIRANSGDSSSERRRMKLRMPPEAAQHERDAPSENGTYSGGSNVRSERLTPVATATPSVTQANTTPQTNGASSVRFRPHR